MVKRPRVVSPKSMIHGLPTQGRWATHTRPYKIPAVLLSRHPLFVSRLTVMDAFEIAWFSSAFAFAYLVYALEPFEPPEGPRDSLIPIKANGRDICVPPALVDVMSDISKFATKFEFALKKAVPGLKSSSGTLWTARIVRDEKPELQKALQGMDRYVPLLAG